MNKAEFLSSLRRGLSGLPKGEIEERLAFYSEIIDDRMEDGVREEDAVNELGDIDALIAQIIADIPLTKLVKEKIKPKNKLKIWEIILLVLGSPIWLSVLVAVIAVIIAVYAVILAVIIALWSVFLALAACVLAIPTGVLFISTAHTLAGVVAIAAGIFSAGLAIFAFFDCREITKLILILTKKIAAAIKNCFITKEEAV